MSHFANYGALSVAAVGALLSAVALAGAEDPAVGDDTDWLIARRNGQWELVAKGPSGRVRKEYPNQEVLRLAADGAGVVVVSMPPEATVEEVACSQRTRSDARDPCSSAFLLCRPNPGGALVGVPLLIMGATGSAVDRRHRLACRADVDAIRRVGNDLGMTPSVAPLQEPLR